MSKAIRIKTTPNGGDKYVKIKLEQDFDFLEVLSLNINQEDVYKRFSSDYGVIVGRVIINNGFGVPNAKVSVFIPLDDIDKNDVLKKGLYPYEKINDRNSDGIRYNLLTQNSDSQNDCFTPVGTFPTKREVLDNDTMLEVYCKYYKFTTTTNYAGDFMIFGVPLGNYTVHLDADISDIGIASQRPYDMISKGASISRFDSTTKFSTGTNLDKLVQIKTLNSGVNVQPFWGDIESYEIGITRLDLDLNYDITPAAIFMGSIYGDKDKHSVNKRCRPRKKLGLLDEQMTNEGTIRMIRKTIDNKIEEFNVDGSELIDEYGAWAYQVPMNLDYMVTDENGNLILSQDPDKGIPTRARVRFSIGMTNDGGEGRLRTRARYLVPNNPKLTSEMDYEFGSKTKENSFRDLHWNKIYTVSNFISRFQRNDGFTTNLTRAATGIKDVENTSKVAFPFNRVNTELNPIFFIICLIMYIVMIIIWFMNKIIYPIINAVIQIIKDILDFLCDIYISNWVFSWHPFDWACVLSAKLNFVACITVECPFEEGSRYAPGCYASSKGFTAAEDEGKKPTYFPGDGDKHTEPDCGLVDCVAFQMARALNLFQFDFYNDWVNGSLFSFLLKYKKRKNKSEKFCESNCDDIPGGGVDGNENGKPDNNCYSSLLTDTCFRSGADSQKNTRAVAINEGIVKKVGNEFYYAATSRDTNIRLFATELVNLGSVFECDWQGIPKIQKFLIPTSFKVPPDIQEKTDDQTVTETSGMVDIGGTTCGNFFSINCKGLHVNPTQCINVRHICEIGVDIDQTEFSLLDNTTILNQADCIISSIDIDDNFGKWVRDVFYGLNKSSTPWIGLNSLTIPSGGYSTDFNTTSNPIKGDYIQTSKTQNGADYVDFRNVSLNQGPVTDNSFGQPDHSYYFYFGLEPGNTGLDKMNKKFFATCIKPQRNNVLIESNSIPDNLNMGTGCTTFSFIGGIGPFNYTFTGLNDPLGNPLNITPIIGSASTSNSDTKICGLFAGTYLISAIDALGTVFSDTIGVSGPTPIYCYSYVSKMLTNDFDTDGEITIGGLGGGIGSLYYELKNSAGTIIRGPRLATSNLVLNGLSSDEIGYTLKIYDESIPPTTCITTGLTITGIKPLVITSKITNVKCYGIPTGKINLTVKGGVPPYTITLTGDNDYYSDFLNNGGLGEGNYTATVVDSIGSAATKTMQVKTDYPQLIIVKPSTAIIATQPDSENYNVPYNITSGVVTTIIKVQYSLTELSGSRVWIPIDVPYNTSNAYILTLPKGSIDSQKGLQIRFWNGIEASPCYSRSISYTAEQMVLPAPTTGGGGGTNIGGVDCSQGYNWSNPKCCQDYNFNTGWCNDKGPPPGGGDGGYNPDGPCYGAGCGPGGGGGVGGQPRLD